MTTWLPNTADVLLCSTEVRATARSPPLLRMRRSSVVVDVRSSAPWLESNVRLRLNWLRAESMNVSSAVASKSSRRSPQRSTSTQATAALGWSAAICSPWAPAATVNGTM